MSDRCVIYCRVSSDEQIQGTSLGSQEAACRAFAERHGWIVDRVFVELGESAKSADRTEFQAMIRYSCVKSRMIRRLLVWKIDRFARQNYDYAVFQALLAGAGVQIVSVTEPAADGPAGKMMQSVLAVVAQFDNDVRAERTKTSMRTLSEQGYWVHKPPTGFKTARVNGKPILVPDPARAPIIAKAFEEIAGGRMNVAEVLAYLKAQGVTAARGQPLAIQTLHAMLRHPIYAGRVQTELTRGVSVKAQFDGLASEATWQRAQLVLSGRSIVPVPRKEVREEFPLRGLIRCPCGTPFTASWSKGRSTLYGYYHCKHGCTGSRARIESVHEQFREVLREISTTHAPLMAAFREIVTRVHERRHEEAAAKRNASGQKLAQLEQRASVLLEKLLDGTITDEVYKAKNQQLQAEIALARVDTHDAEIDSFDTMGALRLAEHMLADLATIWDRANGTDRLRFERAVFPSGIEWSAAEGVRTAAKASVFSALREIRFDNSQLAPQVCGSSNPSEQLDRLLRQLWAVKDMCEAA